MKTLTTNARVKTLTPKGTFPIVVLEIDWPGDTKYYTEFPYSFNSQTCEVALIEIDDFVNSGKVGSIGEVSSVGFKLDDTGGTLKTKVNTQIIEGTYCRIWHHYYDLSSSDATSKLYGRLAGPIKWSEKERVFEAQIESIQATGEIGFAPSEFETDPNYVEDLLPEAYNTPWPIIFGSPKRVPIVKIIGPSDEFPNRAYKYVVGLYIASSISRVLAKRQCYGDKEDDFYIVPSSYYSIGNETIGGRSVTVITFPTLLSNIEGENWEDEIYVDPNSGLSSNIATQIEWILESFTNITIDAPSFAAAAALIGDTPAHFALFDQRDALDLCTKMAWQARCLLVIKDGVAFLRPLFVNSSVDLVLTANEAKLSTLELSFTETEDIVTVFNANWKQDYSGQKESEQKTIFKNEVSRYGVISEDYDFFCFTTLRAIQVSASFWAYRYGHSWRRASLECFLPVLGIEAFDCVQLSYTPFSTYAVRGFVESASHDTEDNVISINLELGSKAGDNSGGQPIEDPQYWTGGSEPKNGYTTPVPAREEKTICESNIENEFKDKIKNAGGTRIHIESGSSLAGKAYEIYWVEKDVFVAEDGETMDVAHVGTPREDNIESGQILFTKETTVGYYGWGFQAGDDVWCDYDENPQNHPNYFDSATYRVGDVVGVEKDQQHLTKARSGFVVTGIQGSKISIGPGSVDPKLEKIKSFDAIPAFSPAEIYGYDGEHTLVRKPTEDNLPPGRIIFPVTTLPAGSRGKGYNAFDVSPYVEGSAPSEIGAEFGTQANSSELVEGNTGFLALGRKDGRNQFRPF